MGSNQAGKSRTAGHPARLVFWLLPLTLLAISSVLAVMGEPAFLQYRYERDAIASGDTWRLATGHLVHLSWGHFFLNMAGLAPGLAAGRRGTRPAPVAGSDRRPGRRY